MEGFNFVKLKAKRPTLKGRSYNKIYSQLVELVPVRAPPDGPGQQHEIENEAH